MNFVLDTHTHTIASGHAYSSIQEMIQAGKEKGLSLLGISEHGPAMPGSCQEIYFLNLKVIPNTYKEIEVLFGAEANIIDYSGKLDLSNETLSHLNYGIASLHTPCLAPGSKKENTKAYLCAMENPYINVIGHPDDGKYPYDTEELVKQAKQTNTLLEVNNSSLSPNSFRMNAHDNVKKFLSYCAELDVPIIVNSDAHISYDVGNFSYAKTLLEEIDFPSNLIVNCDLHLYKKMLADKMRP